MDREFFLRELQTVTELVRTNALAARTCCIQKFSFQSVFEGLEPKLVAIPSRRDQTPVRIGTGEGLLDNSMNGILVLREMLAGSNYTSIVKAENSKTAYDSSRGVSGTIGIVLLNENDLVIFGYFATEERFPNRPNVNDIVRITFKDSASRQRVVDMFAKDTEDYSEESNNNAALIAKILGSMLPSRVNVLEDSYHPETKEMTREDLLEDLKSRFLFSYIKLPSNCIFAKTRNIGGIMDDFKP